jgi:[ribosomal protein S5]-alanine N-acetyltransferase
MGVAIVIRHPTPADETEFIAKSRRSRPLHLPWTKPPTTRREFRGLLDDARDERRRVWLVCLRGSGEIAGVVNVSEIVRGSFRSAYLGYYVFAGFERRGLMRQGLKAVVRHAFYTERLHRLEANIQPTNRASLALAKSCGFVKEGYSRRYLKIGGVWRDHERWAIVAS